MNIQNLYELHKSCGIDSCSLEGLFCDRVWPELHVDNSHNCVLLYMTLQLINLTICPDFHIVQLLPLITLSCYGVLKKVENTAKKTPIS